MIFAAVVYSFIFSYAFVHALDMHLDDENG
jgi:hypothetical protein